jgi:predicted DNA-binding protein (UPF0251 family)
MSRAELEAVVDRAAVDHHFRRTVARWSESLHTEYALSADEVEALRTHDYEALLTLGLDEGHASAATRLI